MIKEEQESHHYVAAKNDPVVKVQLKEQHVLPDQEEYTPSRTKRKIRKLLNKRKKLKSQVYNFSLWTVEQNTSYMQFLSQSYELFTKSNNDRRILKINVLMSKAVKTRSADQCRSHHQKMIKFHNDIPSIIEHIKGLKSCQTNTNTAQENIQVKIQHQENCDP